MSGEAEGSAGPDIIPLMRPWLGPEEAAAAAEALESGWIAQGPRTAAFEEALSNQVGAVEGVAVSSGTAALHLAMLVLDLGPGDEVVVPSLSYIATANAPRYVGATVVFADVDPRTQNLTAATIEPRLTPSTRAVILVHQAGVPADIDAVHALCDPRGIAVVEDAACALGATYGDRPIGAHSDLVIFSFHPRKVITTGEGGMVMTSRRDWADRLRRLRDHGSNRSAPERHASRRVVIEEYVELGFNYRMSDLQAAVGSVQLERLPALVERRRALGAAYQEGLADVPGLETITDPPYGTTNFQSFWVVLPHDFPRARNVVLGDLLDAGIAARRGIMAAHLEPTFAGYRVAELPVTERMSRQSIVLPLFHDMTPREQNRVIDAPQQRGYRRAASDADRIGATPHVTATRPLLLLGAGGLGRETAEAVRAMNAASPTFELIGFLDDDPALADTDVDGVPVVGRIDDVGRYASASVVICTASPHDPSSRQRIVMRLGLAPSRYATVIHPTAVLPPGIEIGPGCVVLASVVATTAVRVGAHTVVMPAVVFSHDDVIGDYATFGAGVHLAGGVRVGEGAYLGAGALVRENTVIGRWAVVGMGAVVIDDVPDGEVWVGVPARFLRGIGTLPETSKAASDG